jgi:DNA ligase D-like protein (predicted ligase)
MEKAQFVEPMQCVPVLRLPEGPGWEYELKLDGYRALGIKSGGHPKLLSRNRKDLSVRFHEVAIALSALPEETVIDGEIVALDENGRPWFGALQNGLPGTVIRFFVFDLMFIGGRNVQKEPLEKRRQVLYQELMRKMPEIICYSETLEAAAADVVSAVREQGLEGVIAKRRDSHYEAGRRSGAWVKMRLNQGQEFVIGGYIPAGGSFDSIIVGYYKGDDLIYVARVRNGFTPALRASVFKQLPPRQTGTCPFVNLPQHDRGRWGEGLTEEKMAQCCWIKPQLVAQIEFAEWTEGDHLRHSKFVALRDDKDPEEIGREPQAEEQ